MNRLHLSLIVLSSVLLLQGCLKSKDNDPPYTPSDTYISVYHLSPLADTIDIYINESIASQSVPYGTIFPAYSPLQPGVMTVAFTEWKKDSTIAIIPAHNYDTLKFYSWVLYNKIEGVGVEATQIEEDFSVLTAQKTFCRFFHFSPNAGAVDIYFDNVLVAQNKKNGDILIDAEGTKFKPFTAGETNIRVTETGTQTELFSPSKHNLRQGGAFTLVLRGDKNNSGDGGLRLSVIQASN